jgi:hypothetical protein
MAARKPSRKATTFNGLAVSVAAMTSSGGVAIVKLQPGVVLSFDFVPDEARRLARALLAAADVADPPTGD